MRYHDKLPSLRVAILDPNTFAAAPTWEYQEDRMMYGISANMPIGDWAVGTELSYRPKDSVMLNPVIDCVPATAANAGRTRRNSSGT